MDPEASKGPEDLKGLRRDRLQGGKVSSTVSKLHKTSSQRKLMRLHMDYLHRS